MSTLLALNDDYKTHAIEQLETQLSVIDSIFLDVAERHSNFFAKHFRTSNLNAVMSQAQLVEAFARDVGNSVASDTERILLKISETLAADTDRLEKTCADLLAQRERHIDPKQLTDWQLPGRTETTAGSLLLRETDAGLTTYHPRAPVHPVPVDNPFQYPIYPLV